MDGGQSIIALATIIWFLRYFLFMTDGNDEFPWLLAIIEIAGITIGIVVLLFLYNLVF